MYLTAAYLIQLLPQRLKNWELRERKKARDYAKDSEREDERRREMVRGQESDLTLDSVYHETAFQLYVTETAVVLVRIKIQKKENA